MAASRRRTTKKNLGQTMNDVDRRLKSVEVRGTYRSSALTSVDGSLISNDTVTIEKLDPELRRLLLKLIDDNQVTNDVVMPLFSEMQDYAVTLGSVAQESADGKNTVIYQNEEPDTEGRQIDDIWFDTNDGYKPHKFNGEEWVAAEFGDGAISDLNVGKLTTGTFAVGMVMSIGAQEIGDQQFWTRLTAMNQSVTVGTEPFRQSTDAFEMRMVDSIQNNYFSRVALSMVWNSLDTSMNPVIKVQRRNLVPVLANVTGRNESSLTGSLSDQELAIWTLTPFDTRYSPYLRGLPSISFDDPTGTPAGQIGSYDVKRFGLEASSGNAWVTISDVSTSTRSVNLYAAGFTGNSRKASMILSGYYGEIIVDEGIFSAQPLLCRIYSTADTTVSTDQWAAVNYNYVQLPKTNPFSYASFSIGTLLSGTNNGGSVTNSIRAVRVPRDGYYRISGQVLFETGSGTRQVSVRALGSTTTTGVAHNVGSNVALVKGDGNGSELTLQYNAIMGLSEGQRICVWAYTSDGADVTGANPDQTYICVEYVGRRSNPDINT